VENYFNYFTEIEDQYLRRRGGGLLLSTLDWALIETWKDAGIPLEAVLRGIDSAFDHYDQRSSKTKKVNSLAYCSQEVLAAAEDMKEAAVGAGDSEPARKSQAGEGFEPATIAAFLRRGAEALERANLPEHKGVSSGAIATEIAQTLRTLAADADQQKPSRLEDLERRLTIFEEKLIAVLLASTPEDQIIAVRSDADRELAPYRRKMSGPQIEQLQKQYLQKRLFEKYHLPRLSLFYM
jgi:hypothetical protein